MNVESASGACSGAHASADKCADDGFPSAPSPLVPGGWRSVGIALLAFALLWLIGLPLPSGAQRAPSESASSAGAGAVRPSVAAAAEAAGNRSGAADVGPDPTPAQALDRLRARVDAIQKQLSDGADNEQLGRLRAEALAIAAQIDPLAAELAPHADRIKARLAELGPAPTESDSNEARDLASQRSALTREQEAVDTQVKLARLLNVEAAQIVGTIANLRRERFQKGLGERIASPLSPQFWTELKAGWGRDAGRAQGLFVELRDAAARAPAPVWLGAFVLIVLAAAARPLGERVIRRFCARRVPAGRLRRSLTAIGVVLLSALSPGLVAAVMYTVVVWGGMLYAPADNLLVGAIGLVVFGGAVAGLGRGLLSARRPSWRLPPITDEFAQRMKGYPRVLAVLIVLLPLFDRLANTISASLETTVAVDTILSLAVGLALAHTIVTAERIRRRVERGSDPSQRPPARPLSLVLLTGGLWTVLMTSLVCLLAGYVALGSFLVRQVAWVQIVVGVTYLLIVFADDLFMTLLGMPANAGADPGGGAGAAGTGAGDRAAGGAAGRAQEQVAARNDARAPHRRQAAVLLSALARVMVVVLALAMLFAPFGEGPLELMDRASRLGDGVAFGELIIRPWAVLKAALVLVLGFAAVRATQRWLGQRFLPTTDIESGMYSSIVTLLGYVGAVVVVAVALVELGFSMDRVAWLASALSVGIGFGLQAVVQNFVSGLILLAERPVKVGDWVALGGAEGDIRRINVRATEIQLSDRSTMIVPNSEFITKTVRNVTRADPLGLVQLKWPMPLSSPPEEVRRCMLEVMVEHPDVLDSPAPRVYLDSIQASGLLFNATASVASPRQVYAVRSELQFSLIARLTAAGLPMSDRLTSSRDASASRAGGVGADPAGDPT